MTSQQNKQKKSVELLDIPLLSTLTPITLVSPEAEVRHCFSSAFTCLGGTRAPVYEQRVTE